MFCIRRSLLTMAATTLCVSLSTPAQAAITFVNGMALSGAALDLSGGSSVNDGRLGYFSDIYYDRNRNEWWGLSDRGPGGGSLSYDTRVQRFTLDVNAATGAISNFQIAETIKFSHAGQALSGLAPNPAGVLGNAFDPEGIVINPLSGNLLVSDEYGPSLYEFDRSGALTKTYNTPSNLVPKVAGVANYVTTPPTTGREGNRGLEGLAISPDGQFAYAVLQNGLADDGLNATGTRSLYTRIVKYDTSTGNAVGQYAYKLDSASAGRGISAIVALGNDKFQVIERNNRGIGVGAAFATADKAVYEINLSGASDVSGIALPATGNLPSGFTAVTKGAKVIDLDANTIDLDGNGLVESAGKSPEKWEGLAVGPQLLDGTYMILAGTDNDYSVTQNSSGTQFDVYFRFSDADPYASSLQCPLGQTIGCFTTASGGSTAASLTSDYQLLPGVLHAYKSGIGDLVGYEASVPEPSTFVLSLGGLALLGAWVRRRCAP
jgi:hypothetical protein